MVWAHTTQALKSACT
uniref:Uncharacterized protein n=1 Tax=Arundo donax TaxID=35708 RepID=A0A0A9HWQ9_ARUDO